MPDHEEAVYRDGGIEWGLLSAICVFAERYGQQELDRFLDDQRRALGVPKRKRKGSSRRWHGRTQRKKRRAPQ